MNPSHLFFKLLLANLLLLSSKATIAQCIDFPENVNLSLTPVMPSCHNEGNGSITVQCAPLYKKQFQFSIDDENYSSTLSFKDLRAGLYTIYAKDKNDSAVHYCRKIDLKAPEKLSYSISKRKKQSCVNVVDCEIGYTVSGGTPPYEIKLIDIVKQDEQQQLLTESGSGLFSKLRPSSYIFQVIDKNGCVTEKVSIFLENAEPLVWNEPIITDESDLEKKDGKAIINVSGGNIPFIYTLKNSDSVIYKNQDNLIGGLSLGSYDIIITDRNGCELKQSLKIGSKVDLRTKNLQDKSKERLLHAETLLRDNKSELRSQKNKYNWARFSTQGVALAGGVLSILVPDKSKGIVAGISAGSTAVLDLFTDMVKLEEEIESRKSINEKLNKQINTFKKAWPPEKMNKVEFTTEEYKKFILDMQLLAAVISECEVLLQNIEQQSK